MMTIVNNKGRLPVPPPPHPEESAAARPTPTPAGASDFPGMPDCLKLSAEQRKAARDKAPVIAKLKATIAKIPATKPKRAGKAKGAKKASKATKVASKPKKPTTAVPNGNGDGPRAGSKLEIVGKLLRAKSGCTAKEVLAATGWPAVSMPQMAKAAGLKLRKEKMKGEPTRYFGT